MNQETTEMDETKKANEETVTETDTEQNAESNEEVADINQAKTEPDYKEKFFYLAAEMENYKKRVEREKSQFIKFGNENILRDLIEVVDNFERTVQALKFDEDDKMKNVVIGIEMVSKQFIDTLAKYGLKEVLALGEIFDPNLHEAIAQEDREGAKTMEVLQVHQKGYTLNERLIRPARVVVQKENNN